MTINETKTPLSNAKQNIFCQTFSHNKFSTLATAMAVAVIMNVLETRVYACLCVCVSCETKPSMHRFAHQAADTHRLTMSEHKNTQKKNNYKLSTKKTTYKFSRYVMRRNAKRVNLW